MDTEETSQFGQDAHFDEGDEITHGLETTELSEVVANTKELSLKDFLVLVVDDIMDNTVMLSLDLQHEGYRVITAADGEQAVKIASQTNPDIILMDIGMPELDGLGAARKIRENDALKTVPLIALTAFSTEGFQIAARDAGFDGYLTKPVDFNRLHELMRRLLPIKR
ncbi:MAG TPA: response regulator [Pyrinomonadaceae bacterium]|nr:response regulator [Pyrinomonadaceae bacterium]